VAPKGEFSHPLVYVDVLKTNKGSSSLGRSEVAPRSQNSSAWAQIELKTDLCGIKGTNLRYIKSEAVEYNRVGGSGSGSGSYLEVCA
jgi:hypothetical protein